MSALGGLGHPHRRRPPPAATGSRRPARRGSTRASPGSSPAWVGEPGCSGAQIAEVVALAVGPERPPVLFHAAAGAIGRWWWPPCVLSVPGRGRRPTCPFFPTRPEVLAELRDRHGSVERVSRRRGRLTAADLTALREALLGRPEVDPGPRTPLAA